jgi:hypothetical protein
MESRGQGRSAMELRNEGICTLQSAHLPRGKTLFRRALVGAIVWRALRQLTRSLC